MLPAAPPERCSCSGKASAYRSSAGTRSPFGAGVGNVCERSAGLEKDLRCLSGQINLFVVGVWLREGTIWIRVDLLHVEPAVGFIAPIQKGIQLPDGGKLVIAYPFSAKSSGIHAGDG